ncbi:MAG: histidine kinase [Denitrovibrio sp.]|nr:MAG: histidine kinase [Denitrovibrio sp.]
MFILNNNRQIVFTNQAFMRFLGIEKMDDILGKRPGEALGCVHSSNVSGCGTTEFCMECGAVNAILKAQSGTEAEEECKLSINSGSSYELFVIAKPFNYLGSELSFFTAKDISDTKRKVALEKIFFHDIMNLASGIYSVTDLFKEESLADLPENMLGLLHQSSTDMINEIQDYRTLLQAERDELPVMMRKIDSKDIIEKSVALYKCFGAKGEVGLEIVEGIENIEFRSDISLISRVITNMLKNALEASKRGETVYIWSEIQDGNIAFNVRNQSVIPDDIQRQIFKRTFTTKANGSGLGTYSMKLLSENFLGGRVDFVSNSDVGTIFTAKFPLNIPSK